MVHSATSPRGRLVSVTGLLLLVSMAGSGVPAAGAPTGSTRQGAAFPIRVSANGLYLVDARGKPFFYQADTSWMLLRLRPEEVDHYLSDRKARGFTALQIMLSDGPWSKTHDGQTPFNGGIDLAKPNEAYFAYADEVIRKAAGQGFVVALAPLWSGCCGMNWTGHRDGKPLPLDQNGPLKAREFGRWLGARYAKFPNILWIMGGDHNPDESLEVICALAAGIHEKAPRHLMTAHNAPDNSSAAFYGDMPWLDLNAAYSYRELQAPVFREWSRTKNVRPVFLIESGYELETNDNRGGTPFRIRRQAYAAVLNGALAGTAYGHRDIWRAAASWQAALAAPGATQVGLARRFFTARAWWKLEPDQGAGLVTEGRGQIDTDDYVSAAWAADGSLVVIYLPSARPISVNMARLSSPARAAWFDPTNGAVRTIGRSPLPNRGILSFSPPGKNTGGGDDWVLTLDTAKL